jgi:hypothetical protein
MAKPNYQYEKRARELAKKQKKEEKLRLKKENAARAADPANQTEGEGEAGDATPPEAPGPEGT